MWKVLERGSGVIYSKLVKFLLIALMLYFIGLFLFIIASLRITWTFGGRLPDDNNGMARSM